VAQARSESPVAEHDLHVRVITEHGEMLRELVLDLSRGYQPLEV
jgi:hypothetical protein